LPVTERGPITCAGCGLLCDDVSLQRSGDLVGLAPPCRVGAEWFTERVRASVEADAATVGGQAADLETAVARAVELLRGARRPLLHGFEWATVEDARAAVALADRLGALVVTDGVEEAWPGAPAFPLRGASTATLGEIRDRSRVVVIWREDPVTTHPRLLDRLDLGGDRTLVTVDDRDTETARRANLRLGWGRERDLEALSALHVLERGLALGSGETGGELEGLHGLVEQLLAAPHVAFVYGPGLTAGTGGQRRALALEALVRALSHDRHVVTLPLPGAAGTRGADDVLAWQTGYPGRVDLADGHPELVTATRPVLDAGGVDVSVCIEGVPGPPRPGVARLELSSVPTADVDVSIRTAAAGVAATGTAHRLDGVPLALQAPLPGDGPTAAALLGRLLAELAR
jgi:formylmethanofuran dehydrogenase subunit B